MIRDAPATSALDAFAQGLDAWGAGDTEPPVPGVGTDVVYLVDNTESDQNLQIKAVDYYDYDKSEGIGIYGEFPAPVDLFGESFTFMGGYEKALLFHDDTYYLLDVTDSFSVISQYTTEFGGGGQLVSGYQTENLYLRDNGLLATVSQASSTEMSICRVNDSFSVIDGPDAITETHTLSGAFMPMMAGPHGFVSFQAGGQTKIFAHVVATLASDGELTDHNDSILFHLQGVDAAGGQLYGYGMIPGQTLTWWDPATLTGYDQRPPAQIGVQSPDLGGFLNFTGRIWNLAGHVVVEDRRVELDGTEALCTGGTVNAGTYSQSIARIPHLPYDWTGTLGSLSVAGSVLKLDAGTPYNGVIIPAHTADGDCFVDCFGDGSVYARVIAETAGHPDYAGVEADIDLDVSATGDDFEQLYELNYLVEPVRAHTVTVEIYAASGLIGAAYDSLALVRSANPGV